MLRPEKWLPLRLGGTQIPHRRIAARGERLSGRSAAFHISRLCSSLVVAAQAKTDLAAGHGRSLFQRGLRLPWRCACVCHPRKLRPSFARQPVAAAGHVGYHACAFQRAVRPAFARNRKRRPLHRHAALRRQRWRLFNRVGYGQVSPVPAAYFRRPGPAWRCPCRSAQAPAAQIGSRAESRGRSYGHWAWDGFKSAIRTALR